MRRKSAHEHLSPLEICQLNAHRKARAVAKKIPDALVLGADTLVFLDGEIFGKPRDACRSGTNVRQPARAARIRSSPASASSICAAIANGFLPRAPM